MSFFNKSQPLSLHPKLSFKEKISNYFYKNLPYFMIGLGVLIMVSVLIAGFVLGCQVESGQLYNHLGDVAIVKNTLLLMGHNGPMGVLA